MAHHCSTAVILVLLVIGQNAQALSIAARRLFPNPISPQPGSLTAAKPVSKPKKATTVTSNILSGLFGGNKGPQVPPSVGFLKPAAPFISASSNGKSGLGVLGISSRRVTQFADVPKLKLAGSAKPRASDSRKFIVRLKNNANALKAERTLTAAVKTLNSRQPLSVLKSKKVTKNFQVGKSKFLTMYADVTDMEQLKNDPNIEYIEQNVRVWPASYCALTNSKASSWGLDMLDSRRGKFDKKFRPIGNDGRGVYVYILDTGIRSSHSDFDTRVISGKSFVSGRRSDQDGHGHGTHIASLVGGKTYGVARKVNLVAVKILKDDAYGTLVDVLDGMDYAISDCKKRKGRCIINLSLTAMTVSHAWEDVIKEATDQGIVVTAAAGNSQRDACLGSPAHSNHAIVIAGAQYKDSKLGFASYSNYGPCVNVIAPGTSILGASHSSNAGTTKLDGSSQATAFVSGAAALFLSAMPNLTPRVVSMFLHLWSTHGIVQSVPRDTPNRMLYAGC
ncbi:uncharacterized protein LOC106176025 [Lingula anatina]|uniref:Uncharacterized protein LOC106176025 n=1 Tax=Lingula anatina TaxID=7574 RepID=A0A1S3JUC5_LINAN|nr:uncharacterized protein LOC106176025 [Lingula anatina]|eukprot:XP_013413689.1 uncharacterized protein LOC106176025 [Lingula anatina]